MLPLRFGLICCLTTLAFACSIQRSSPPSVDETEAEGSNVVREMRAHERAQLARHPTIARRDGSRLVLTLQTGQPVVLQDVTEENYSTDVVHGFFNYFPQIACAVIHLQFYEGDGYMMVDLRSGQQTYLAAEPVLSPSAQRFVVASCDLMAGYNPNVMQIWRLAPEGPQIEWELEPEEWGPGDPVWLDDQTVRFYKYFSDILEESTETRVSTLVKMAGGAWRVDEESNESTGWQYVVSGHDPIGGGNEWETLAYALPTGWTRLDSDSEPDTVEFRSDRDPAIRFSSHVDYAPWWGARDLGFEELRIGDSAVRYLPSQKLKEHLAVEGATFGTIDVGSYRLQEVSGELSLERMGADHIPVLVSIEELQTGDDERGFLKRVQLATPSEHIQLICQGPTPLLAAYEETCNRILESVEYVLVDDRLVPTGTERADDTARSDYERFAEAYPKARSSTPD